jgi:hypothetical protein
MGGGLLAPAQPPSWRATPCRLSATAIQYIRSYPPYLEAVSSIRNLSTRHAVVKKGPPKMVSEERKCGGFWWESPKKRGHLEDQGVDGRMGSELVLGRLAGGCGVDLVGRR